METRKDGARIGISHELEKILIEMQSDATGSGARYATRAYRNMNHQFNKSCKLRPREKKSRKSHLVVSLDTPRDTNIESVVFVRAALGACTVWITRYRLYG